MNKIEGQLTPGLKCAWYWRSNVRVHSVDLSEILPSIRHSYSGSEALIKYSEAKYSPVSTEPTDQIRLALPSYYKKFEQEPGSGGIADESEGEYTESSTTGIGSRMMQIMDESFRVSLGPGIQKNITIKWNFDDFGWMYCTSIDPHTNYKRKIQMKCLNQGYDFMTRIERPSEFAKHLGYAYRKQISSTDLIDVYHGPVIYSQNKNALMNSIPGEDENKIILTLFVKPKDYQEQQEYRFIINRSFHKPDQKLLYIETSDELRNLMSPIE